MNTIVKRFAVAARRVRLRGFRLFQGNELTPVASNNNKEEANYYNYRSHGRTGSDVDRWRNR